MNNNMLVKDLVCPIGKKQLKTDGDFLVCEKCNVKYPVKEGIINLLISDAVMPDDLHSLDELDCLKK